MKIRNGFVSNSSSEAFICNTDKSLAEVKSFLKKILKRYSEETEKNYSFGQCFLDPVKGLSFEDFMFLSDYMNYDFYKTEKGKVITYPEIKNKIIIYSATDNSIPYELFTTISYNLQAIRVHMG